MLAVKEGILDGSEVISTVEEELEAAGRGFKAELLLFNDDEMSVRVEEDEAVVSLLYAAEATLKSAPDIKSLKATITEYLENCFQC